MGYGECEYCIPSKSWELCKWFKLYTVSDRVIYGKCWDTDKLYSMWQWHDDQWVWEDQL